MDEVMRILVLGSHGMIGHKLFVELQRLGHDVYGTTRTLDKKLPQGMNPFLSKTISNIDAFQFSSIEQVLDEVRPDFVINAIGIIKQSHETRDHDLCYQINALFPHKLAYACEYRKIRLLQLSTDCVFSGLKGAYTEADTPDAQDIYGQTKFLGEVTNLNYTLTIRISAIGKELGSKRGLLEWFLNANDKVRGFSGALYTGFTTIQLAKIIHQYILPNKDLRGLFHVSSDCIDKYTLLKNLNESFHKNLLVEKVSTPVIKRDLNSLKFQQTTQFKSPSWAMMVDELAKDTFDYNF
jgi:dTDP-4-dehydrorhamnose reductase